MACKLNETMRTVINRIASTETPSELEIPSGEASIFQAACGVLQVKLVPRSGGLL